MSLGDFTDKRFIRDYVALLTREVSRKSAAKIVLLEMSAAIFSLLSVLIISLIAQFLAQQSYSDLILVSTFLTDYSSSIEESHLLVLLLIALFLSICLSSAIEYLSIKTIRKISRLRYKLRLENNIRQFARSRGSHLHFQEATLQYLIPSFTIEGHINFMALDGMLRAIRPAVYCLIYTVPLLFLGPKVFFLIVLLLLVLLFAYAAVSKSTLKSSKAVFGQKRKQLYADISSTIRRIDARKPMNDDDLADLDFYNEADFELMLDSFDLWKLSPDKTSMYMQMVKGGALILGVLFVVQWPESTSSGAVPYLVFFAILFNKLGASISNFFSKLAVLAKLFPIVNRQRELTGTLNIANHESLKSSPPSPSSPQSWIVLRGTGELRKSIIGLVDIQLREQVGDFSLESVIGSNGDRIGSRTHKRLDFEQLFNEYERRNDALHPLYVEFRDTLRSKCVDIKMEPEKVWKVASSTTRDFLNLVAINLDPAIDVIFCPLGKVESLQKVFDQGAFVFNKPMLSVIKSNVKVSDKHFAAQIKLEGGVDAALLTNDADLLG